MRLGRLPISAGMFLNFQNVILIRKTFADPLYFISFDKVKFSVNAKIFKD